MSVQRWTEATGSGILVLEESTALSVIDTEIDTERLLLDLDTTDEAEFEDAEETGEEGALSGQEPVEAEYGAEEVDNPPEVEETLQPEEEVAQEAD